MTRELEVSVNGQPVGWLREDNDVWELEYVSTWIEASGGFDLSPALSRSRRVHRDGATDRPVQWYFDNLLPEEGARTLAASDAHLPEEDAFALLACFGSESAGSLVLHDPAEPAASERGLKPLSVSELSRRIAGLSRASFSKDAPKKMSLAGAQHKLLLVLDHGQMFEPLPATPSTHILKPDHLARDLYPSTVMNEYFTMRLARELGLNVPSVERFYVPQPAYLVERFDRLPGPSADSARRMHILDMCQLLNKPRSFKYTAAHLGTLRQGIELCRRKAAARQQIYRWLVFNILSGNADSHLKNISFRVDAAGIDLAPAYDLLCTAVYETRPMAGDHATWPATSLTIPLEGASTFAAVTRASILAAGRTLGMTAAAAQRQLDSLVKAIPEAAERLIGEIRSGIDAAVAASPDPEITRRHAMAEMYMLGVAHRIVIKEMTQRLA
jgi:serine/threonine-protein kinase HipA